MNILQEVVSRIGHLPIGDPAAMRSYARRLQAEADAIRARAQSVTGTVEGARYESPAATRLKHGAADVHGRLFRAAARLNGLADSILRAASQVERDQNWWRTEFAKVEHEIEQKLRHH